MDFWEIVSWLPYLLLIITELCASFWTRTFRKNSFNPKIVSIPGFCLNIPFLFLYKPLSSCRNLAIHSKLAYGTSTQACCSRLYESSLSILLHLCPRFILIFNILGSLDTTMFLIFSTEIQISNKIIRFITTNGPNLSKPNG